jgi:hypothetical protein
MRYVVFGTPFHFKNAKIYKEEDILSGNLTRKEGTFERKIISSVYRDFDSFDMIPVNQYYYTPLCVFGFSLIEEAKFYIAKNRLRYLESVSHYDNPCVVGEYIKTLRYFNSKKHQFPEYLL